MADRDAPSPPDASVSSERDERSPSATAEPAASGAVAFGGGAVLLVGAAIFAWSMLGSGSGEDATGPAGSRGKGGPKASGPAAVRVHDVEVGSLTRERRVPGEIFVKHRVVLRARSSGEVVQVGPGLGQAVKVGDLIAALDQGTLSAEIVRAQALVAAAAARTRRADTVVAQAKRELVRSQDLAKQGAASAAELEQGAAAVALADADLAIAAAEQDRAGADLAVLRVRQRQTRVTAPFSGRLAALQVEQGSMLNAGEPVAVLIGNEPPRVRFAMGASEATALKMGAPVIVHVAGTTVSGEIDALGAEVDEESRTLTAEATLLLTEDSPAVLPGTFVEIEVAMGATAAATVVPLEALLGTGPVRQIIVVEQGEAKFVETRVLLEDGQNAAVSGVRAGQRVVIGGQDGLTDGAKVEVVR